MLQVLQFLAVLRGNRLWDLFCKGGVVAVACEIAAADHYYPHTPRACGQKLSHNDLPRSISGDTDAADALIQQEVFQQKRAEFVSEFKCLDQ